MCEHVQFFEEKMKTDSKRMQFIAGRIPECSCLLDIGCDHGKLELLLTEKYPNIRIIASDISPYALKKTEYVVKQNTLEERVFCRCGDGLSVVDEDDGIEFVVIAGIGGYVIADILEKGLGQIAAVKELFLLPSTDVETLRRRLPGLGLRIKDEQTIEEQNRVYSLICVEHGCEEHTEELDLKYGHYLLKRKDDLLKKKLHKHQKALQKALEMISGTENADRIAIIRQELSDTEKTLQYLEEI